MEEIALSVEERQPNPRSAGMRRTNEVEIEDPGGLHKSHETALFARLNRPTWDAPPAMSGDMGPTMVLHGLWPQPSTNQYCGVPKEIVDQSRKIRGSDIPAVELSEDVRNDLRPIMSDVAVMAPHEWYAHGTCAGVTPDEYFGDAAKLTDQARTILDPVFRAAKGKHLTLSTVRDKFDAAFGDGAGERVGLSCRNVTGQGSVIYEVQMSLPPVVFEHQRRGGVAGGPAPQRATDLRPMSAWARALKS
jgi:hypothetical protein